MPRKQRTKGLQAVVDKVNDMLARSTVTPEKRDGIIALVSALLHESGTYRGFGYLDASQVPEGHRPGIIRHLGASPEFPDETRRFYY